MKKIPQLLILTTFLSSISSLAISANDCSKFLSYEKQFGVSFDGCKCGDSLKIRKLLIKKGLELIAACGDEKLSEGRFYYVGNSSFDGLISYPDGPNETLSFVTKNNSFVILAGEKVINDIKYPKEKAEAIFPEKLCSSGELTANAKIKVKFVEEVMGDSCQAGIFALDYKVIHVGKYSCMQ